MNELIAKMNKLLASSFTMYLKAHNFHWNLEHPDFPQYHDFFGDLYSEIHGSIDSTAEQIRAIGGIAQGSLTAIKENSAVRDQVTTPPLSEMLAQLKRDNDTVLAVLMEVHEAATPQKEFGLINYIEGRMDIHKKHGWMLKASMNRTGVTEQVAESLDETVKTYVLQVNG